MRPRLPLLGRRRRRAATETSAPEPPAPVRHDPTRPGAARIVDDVPIAHEGPPGYPGRPAVPGDDDPAITG